MARTNAARVGGSGYTVLKWHWPGTSPAWHDIGFAQQITHTSPSPVAQPVPIQPMNRMRPVEIITARAVAYGQLQLQLIELWNSPIWDQLAGLANSNDLHTILEAVSERNDEIMVQSVITPPTSVGKQYAITYHGCVIADVRDDETLDVTTMQVNKNIDIWYRWCQHGSRDLHFGSTSDQPGVH